MDFSIVPTFIATIRRLQRRDSLGDPVWRRKAGTGLKKSYGVKEISAVRKSIEKNPFMTSYQIKLSKKKQMLMDQEEVLGQLVVIGGGTAVGQENGVLALQRYRELLHQQWSVLYI